MNSMGNTTTTTATMTAIILTYEGRERRQWRLRRRQRGPENKRETQCDEAFYTQPGWSRRLSEPMLSHVEGGPGSDSNTHIEGGRGKEGVREREKKHNGCLQFVNEHNANITSAPLFLDLGSASPCLVWPQWKPVSPEPWTDCVPGWLN